MSAAARVTIQNKKLKIPINFFMLPVANNTAFGFAVHQVDPVTLVFQGIEQPESFIL